MLIVVTNNKGGQGKTLFATLIAKYLLANPANKHLVSCCDVDKTQQNFKDNMSGDSVFFFNDISEIPEHTLCVVDTPANLEVSTPSIKAADILVVPVVLGKHAVQGVHRVLEIREKRDLRIVANEWDDSEIQNEALDFLNQSQLEIYGKIPKYKKLAHNIDTGINWDYGLPEGPIKLIIEVLVKLLKVKDELMI
jgi:CO dehydrogenase nickel-insertion accessory protein CooC1